MISVISTLIVSLMGPYSVETVLAIIAGFVYLLGVQGLRILVHLPLNICIQTVNFGKRAASALREERLLFEVRWIRFNWIRIVIGLGVTVAFTVALSLKSS